MKSALVLLAVLILPPLASAQESGNRIYQPESGNQIYGTSQSNAGNVPLAGDLLLYDPKDMAPSPYVEASVLMNVKPDAFVAVFAIAQEAPTAADSNRKTDKLVADLTAAAQPIGFKGEDVYVDFIAQIPVYDYSVTGRTAREGLTGFQTKKTVAFRYTNRAQLEPLVAAAAVLGVYDLIKVDYVVTDMGPVRQRLFEEASKVIARKVAAYGSLLGIALKPASIYEEHYRAVAPADLYKTYAAYESGDASAARVVDKRKAVTSYYDPITSATFDAVVTPAGIEPMVQASIFLKVRCQFAR